MTTVHQAIAAVISDLEGVAKSQRNKEQGYNFRGIDDVLKELHPLLGKHGVFLAPDVVEREYEERVSKSGTVGHCAHLHVRFRVYGPEGDSVELSTWGEGLDYGDKATNKAATAAFKYALFELFAVSDPADDGDHETPEGGRTEPRAPAAPATRPTSRRPPPVPAPQLHDPSTGELAPAGGAGEAQLRALARLKDANDLSTHDLLVYASTAVNRPLQALGDLTVAEANVVIDQLKNFVAGDHPVLREKGTT